jgi:hypothetical protein
MTPRARLALVAAAVVALVVAFVVASGSGDDKTSGSAATTAAAAAPAATSTSAATTPAPAPAPAAKATVPVVRVVDAKPVGGVKRLKFTKGDTIRFSVRSDTADEIHVHGYDVHKDVTAGGKVTFSIPANIEGRFVVELEGKGEQIAELEVDPK